MPDWREVARQEAVRAGIDPNLFLKQLGIEAGFRPSAVSPAGAAGIAQIMPFHDVDPRRPGHQRSGVNPYTDLRWSANHMATLIRKYGNWKDALSVYNSGRPWSKGQGIEETRSYVAKILGGGEGRVSVQARPGGPAVNMSGSAPLAQDSMKSALISTLLQGAQRAVAGEAPDPGSLMQLAMMRRQIEAASQQYGPAPTDGSLVPGGAGRPLNTPMGSSSEFGIVDAEGAPGPGGKRYHAGKDWFGPAGSAVYAPWGGKVVEVKASKGNSGQVFGGTVKIQAANGRVFVARHVNPGQFKVGQQVKAGQAVATVSDWTGGKPHAHVEVWKTLGGGYSYSNMIDPVSVFGRRK